MHAYRMSLAVHQQSTVTMIFITIQIALLLLFHIKTICCADNNRHYSAAYHHYDIDNGRSSPLHYQHQLSIINERNNLEEQKLEQGDQQEQEVMRRLEERRKEEVMQRRKMNREWRDALRKRAKEIFDIWDD